MIEPSVRKLLNQMTDADLAELYDDLDHTRRDLKVIELGSAETISYWKSQAVEARRYGQWRDRAHASTVTEARRQAARAEQAEAEVTETTGIIRALRRQRGQAETAVARVRALHIPTGRMYSGAPACQGCMEDNPWEAPSHPCPTITALDEPQEPTP